MNISRTVIAKGIEYNYKARPQKQVFQKGTTISDGIGKTIIPQQVATLPLQRISKGDAMKWFANNEGRFNSSLYDEVIRVKNCNI
jgi:hypothetical protein